MIKKATFGAGCFWTPEEKFRKVKGVTKTTVGYMGGDYDNPSYEDVCYKNTGHAEVVQVEYDDKVISYPELLSIFWKLHDPTQLNRQGPDIGDQYRSVIFYHNKEDKDNAKKSLEKEQNKHKDKITTLILEASKFYKAEEYHQKYLMKRGLNTCG